MKQGDLVEVLSPEELKPRGLGVITSKEPLTRLGQHYQDCRYYDVMINDEILVIKEEYIRVVRSQENENG